MYLMHMTVMTHGGGMVEVSSDPRALKDSKMRWCLENLQVSHESLM